MSRLCLTTLLALLVPLVLGAGDARDLGLASYQQMQSEARVALVIGNGAYPSGPLRNPPNDARAVAAKLGGLGFDVTLRVDLAHRGSAATEAYRVVALVREGIWAGSRRHLLDPFGYGAHRFEIRDAASGALLYSRGYSSLFGEWRSTPEAKRRSRSFAESIRIPLPRRPVILAIYSRQRSGRFARVLQKRLDVAGRAVHRWRRDPDS